MILNIRHKNSLKSLKMLFGVISMTIGSSGEAGIDTWFTLGELVIGDATFEDIFIERFLFHSLSGLQRSA